MATQAPRRNDLFAQLASDDRRQDRHRRSCCCCSACSAAVLHGPGRKRDAAKKTGDGLQASQRDLTAIDALEALQKKICGGRPDCVVENQLRPTCGGRRALPAERAQRVPVDAAAQADDAGVTFKGWSHLAEAPVDKYVKVPIAVEVEGTSAAQLLQLLALWWIRGGGRSRTDRARQGGGGQRKWDGSYHREPQRGPDRGAQRRIVLLAKVHRAAFRQDEETGGRAGGRRPPARRAGAPARPLLAPPPSLLGGQNQLEEEKARTALFQ
jgi:hypothetical protein